MKIKFPYLKALLPGAILGLAAGAAQAQQLVKVDGSSTVFPIIEAVAEDFQKSTKGKTRVTVGISGTGGGMRKFCRGETDISNASRPITKAEMADCAKAGITYLEMPVAYDALTLVIHPKNTFLKSATVAEMKKLWEPGAQGKVTRWNQVNPSWPDAPIKLFGAGTDSGTFEYFTEAIVGKPKSSRGDYTASEDDNVLVQGVSRDVNAIGYFGYAYYAENRDKVKGLPIVNEKLGKPIEPSAETVINGTYQPLSRPIFIYVNAKAAGRQDVKDFIAFMNTHAQRLVKDVKYVPLPPQAYTYNQDTLTKMRLGTKFGGENKVGLTIEELMKMEAKL